MRGNDKLTHTFEADVSQLFLLDLFVIFKFLTKINSKVRRKYPAKDWPVAGCLGLLPALNDSTEKNGAVLNTASALKAVFDTNACPLARGK